MNRMRLTVSGVRGLRPGHREYTVRDTRIPSLCVRVYPSGTRTHVCQFGNGGSHWVQVLTVDEARWECLRLQSETGGRTVRAPVFAAFARSEWRDSGVPRCKPSTIRGRDRILETQLLPAFGNMRMDRIMPADIHSWFDDYSRTSPGAANLALKVLRQIFNHAVKLERITVNPARGVKANPSPKRTRFLSPEETRHVHNILDRHAGGRRGQQADIIRLLILTGSRKTRLSA